jgi:hypothetical protein
MFALIAAAGVVYATVILTRGGRLPLPLRGIVAALGGYGTIAYVHGTISGVPLTSLLAGESFWRALPYVFQGAIVGGLILLPLGLIVAVARCGLRTPAPGSRARAHREVAALVTAFATVVSALPPRRSPVMTERESPSGTAAPATGLTPSVQLLAALENSFRAMEDGERQSARDLWDPEFLISQVGREPLALFEWVRDNTFWIPYRGVLRGPVGVLMDRMGNSLDRSLLLATLLEKAGHQVRLAQGEMDRDAAMAQVSVLSAERTAAILLSPPEQGPTELEFQAAANQYQLDAGSIRHALAAQSLASRTMLSTLAQRVEDHTKRLQAAIAGNRAPEDDRTHRFGAAVDALRDHWWVQWNDGSAWVDLDVLAPDGSAGEASATPLGTAGLAAAVEGLHHEIAIRLVVEQWSAGTLSERQVFTHLLRPADLHGTPVVLQIWPVDWPSDFPAGDPHRAMRTASLEQTQWLATLAVGSNIVAMSVINANGEPEDPRRGGPMSGLGAALGRALGGSEPARADRKVLSAAWLEYEVRGPGEPPRKIRRGVFDSLDPAARASNQVAAVALDNERKLSRALSLMMRTEILPVAYRLAPEYVLHLTWRALLANRELVLALARGEFTPENSSIEQIAARAAPSPSPLYALALVRFLNGRSATDTYIDRLGILSRHTFFVSTARGIRLRDATDIVANEIGVDPMVDDAFGARLTQGVLDTNAEVLVQNGRPVVASTAEAFASSSQWIALKSADDARIETLAVSDAARWRLRQDLAAGLIVVAPAAPVTLASESFSGWWRIDPRSGDALGVGAEGWGISLVERAQQLAWAAVAGFMFEYLLCHVRGPSTSPPNDISHFLPMRPTKPRWSLIDLVIVPVEAVSDCYLDALFAGLLAGGVEAVAPTWPIVEATVRRLLRGPRAPSLPPRTPPIPPKAPPKTPPPPEPPVEAPKPPHRPGQPPEECPAGGGRMPEREPRVELGGRRDLSGNPAKRSEMERALAKAEEDVRLAKTALEKSRAAERLAWVQREAEANEYALKALGEMYEAYGSYSTKMAEWHQQATAARKAGPAEYESFIKNNYLSNSPEFKRYSAAMEKLVRAERELARIRWGTGGSTDSFAPTELDIPTPETLTDPNAPPRPPRSPQAPKCESDQSRIAKSVVAGVGAESAVKKYRDRQ